MISYFKDMYVRAEDGTQYCATSPFKLSVNFGCTFAKSIGGIVSTLAKPLAWSAATCAPVYGAFLTGGAAYSSNLGNAQISRQTETYIQTTVILLGIAFTLANKAYRQRLATQPRRNEHFARIEKEHSRWANGMDMHRAAKHQLRVAKFLTRRNDKFEDDRLERAERTAREIRYLNSLNQ